MGVWEYGRKGEEIITPAPLRPFSLMAVYVLKRPLDIIGSLIGLLLTLPLYFLIALAIKLDSPGPVLFRSDRVGEGGRIFRMMKFRSMAVGSDRRGPAITAAGDSRVTRVGRWLRRTKLDELPQLWNVLRGEMSLVGPRPEVPQYVGFYTESERKVLAIKPGITDPASIFFRNEEELLTAADNQEAFYVHEILPAKLRMNLEYLETMSLRADLKVLLRTLLRIVSPLKKDEVKKDSVELRWQK